MPVQKSITSTMTIQHYVCGEAKSNGVQKSASSVYLQESWLHGMCRLADAGRRPSLIG